MKNINLANFNKLFKKGEQIFVGFKDGETSGFIKTVNEQGFGLVKLHDHKEIMYTWDQFNIICTPGFRVKKVGKAVEAKLWELIALNKEPEWFCMYPEKEDHRVLDEIKYFLAQEGLCGLTLTDIKTIDSGEIKFELNNVKGNVSLEKKRDLYRRDNNTIQQTIDLDPSRLYITSPDKESQDFFGDFKEIIDSIRDDTLEWEDERIICGDPWSIEDITSVKDCIFHSLQGHLMVKHESDFWI